jgi:soluble lytic murein transglycosylase-like protein
LRRSSVILLLAVLAAPAAQAANYAVMNTGMRVRIDRHETEGQATRLFLPGGGMVEVPAGSVLSFESDEYNPPPVITSAVGISAPAAPAPAGLLDLIKNTGQRHGLDPDLIHSVIRAESGGNPRAVSAKGAGGLMQLMPATAKDLNVANVFDPVQNVDGGTRYLRQLLGLYNNDLQLALAAYNAGPEKVAVYKGVPPYRETREYVARVISEYNRRKLRN